ncbi:3-deoxy-D-manno-octulosonic acid transferase [Alphaproteobacteria bacterium]|nr:3-deoxy-D-manno-octulosonic acid transferase [Alphaproteobacteria bacterium]
MINFSRRASNGKEEKARLSERFGRSKISRPNGKLIWIHSASVGEIVSVFPILEKLLKDTNATLLVTTSTVNSAKIINKFNFKRTIHQYAPIDLITCVGRFINYWNPSLVIWTESELWPNTLNLLQKKNIRHVMLNGRISNKSYNQWKFMKIITSYLLNGFEFFSVQSVEDCKKFKLLGLRNNIILGNLKYSVEKHQFDTMVLSNLKKTFENKLIWLAASTHEGEESLAFDVHKIASTIIPNLLTIVAPRHPERGKKIQSELISNGAIVALRSEGQIPDDNTEVYIADTIGEMGLWFSLAKVVWMGKSIVGKGGQNPIEPSFFKCAIICGNKMDNFRDVTKKMLDANALIQVDNVNDLAEKVIFLITKPEKAEDMGNKAYNFVQEEKKVIDKVYDNLLPILESLELKGFN